MNRKKIAIIALSLFCFLILLLAANSFYEEWKAKPENRDPHEISGVIYYNNGTLAEGVTVSVEKLNNGREPITSTTTGKDGAYKFSVPFCFLNQSVYSEGIYKPVDNPGGIVVGFGTTQKIGESWDCGESLISVTANKSGFKDRTEFEIAGRTKKVKDITIYTIDENANNPSTNTSVKFNWKKQENCEIVAVAGTQGEVLSKTAPPPKEVVPTKTAIPRMDTNPEIDMEAPESIPNGNSFTVGFKINPKENIITGIEINVFGEKIKVEEVQLIASEEFSLPGEINAGNVQNIVLTNKNGFSGIFMTVKFTATEPGQANIKVRATAINENYASTEVTALKNFEIKG